MRAESCVSTMDYTDINKSAMPTHQLLETIPQTLPRFIDLDIQSGMEAVNCTTYPKLAPSPDVSRIGLSVKVDVASSIFANLQFIGFT